MLRWTKPVREMLATHELFRKMGFPADDLFFNLYSGGEVQFQLKHKGKDLTINIVGEQSVLKPDGRSKEEFEAEYQRAVHWWNSPSTPEVERKRIYEESIIRGEAVPIVMLLKDKGITAPKTLN